MMQERNNVFHIYWMKLVVVNPRLGDDKIKLTMTAASLKKQLQKAYEAGLADKPKSSMSDLFGGMFGGKP